MQLMSTVVMDQPSKHQPLSLLFLGTESIFSQQILSQLAAAFPIQAVFLPARPEQQAPVQQAPVQQLSAETIEPSTDELSLLTQFITTTTLHIAWQHNLPVYALRTARHAAVHQLIQTLAPDLVCVACFPWRIPIELLAIPTYGFVNLHPSLLPAYRGPAPLFWQLRDGLQRSGVTLHRMDHTFDTGKILAQQSLPLAEGASGPTLDHDYAQVGGALLNTFLSDLTHRGAIERKGAPQSGHASTQSWPQATDFTLDPAWSARRAFNFMRGTAEWGHPYSITLAGHAYRLTNALRYAATGSVATPPTTPTSQSQGGELALQFTPGVLYASGRLLK